MAKGYLKSQYEDKPGSKVNDSPTLSTKTLYTPLQNAQSKLNPTVLDRSDELLGADQALQVFADTYAPDFNLQQRLYPDSTGFRLKHILGAPTTTAGDGTITDPDSNAVPVGAYKHVWTAPFGPTGVTPLTTQEILAYVEQSFFLQANGVALSQLQITNPEQGGSQLQAQGIALWLQKISDPSDTTSYESMSIEPFRRRGLTLTWGSQDPVEASDFSLTIDRSVTATSDLGVDAGGFPNRMEKGDDPSKVSGSIPKRVILADDFTKLLDASAFSATAVWRTGTDIGSTSYTYGLWVEMPNCQYTGGDGPDQLENKNTIGASFDFTATYNGSDDSATITLVNATESYA